jgi:hypothetical protein
VAHALRRCRRLEHVEERERHVAGERGRVVRTGKLCARTQWLESQLKDLWNDEEAIKQAKEAHSALLRKY